MILNVFNIKSGDDNGKGVEMVLVFAKFFSEISKINKVKNVYKSKLILCMYLFFVFW